MKKIIRIICFFSLIFAFQTTLAQEMSDQQKTERCENNKKRLAESEQQSKEIAIELSKYSDEKIAQARTELRFVKRYLHSMPTKEEVNTLHRIEEKYKNTAYLEEELSYFIDKGVAFNKNQATSLKRQKQVFDEQIVYHRNNLIALGCNGTGNWTLVSVTVTPENPQVTWGNNVWVYNAQSSSAHYSINNGAYKVDYSWTPPPQQFTSNGFSVSVNFQGTTIAGQPISGNIGVSGSGISSDTPEAERTVHAAGGDGSVSAQKTIQFKPTPNSFDVEVKIGMGWAVTYTYKYRRS